MLNLFLTRYKNQIKIAGGLLIVILLLGFWWFQQQTATPKQVDLAPADEAVTNSQVSQSASSKPVEQIKSQNSVSADISAGQAVVVDVKGGVRRPDVYTFKKVPLVKEVLTKAGGTLPDVRLNRLNLAAEVQNGQVLFVPLGDEEIPSEYPLPGKEISASTQNGGGTQTAASGLISLNSATETDLQTLPGIGAKRAADIIAQRDSMGGFQTVEDLKKVSGLGDKTLEKLAPLVSVP